jgi:hypothetical protein
MKLKWNIFYFILSAILLSIILILLYNFKTKLETEFNKKYSQIKNECDLVQDVLMNNLTNSNSNIGFRFNDDIIVEDTACNKLKLINIINGENVLIYRISDTHCSTCDVAGIKSLLRTNSKIPYNKIIIIGSFYNTKLLNSYITANNIKYRSYNLKQSINIKAEKFNFPYFIIVNKNLEVLSCFFPEKTKPYLTEYFFSGIKHLLNNY